MFLMIELNSQSAKIRSLILPKVNMKKKFQILPRTPNMEGIDNKQPCKNQTKKHFLVVSWSQTIHRRVSKCHREKHI